MFAYLCVCQRPVYQKVYEHYPHVSFHTSLPFPGLKHPPRRDQLHLSWCRNPEPRTPLMPERVSFWQSFLKKFPELPCREGSAFNFIAAHTNPSSRLRSVPSVNGVSKCAPCALAAPSPRSSSPLKPSLLQPP